MATTPTEVSTRRTALAAKHGYAPNEVVQVNSRGIRVLADAYAREQTPSSICEYASGDATVFVSWATQEQEAEATAASENDWRETIGETLYNEVVDLRRAIAERD